MTISLLVKGNSKMIFFTADPHYGHTEIIEYCKRPFFKSQHMDMQLIKQHNSIVSDLDEIYIIGDFTLKGINNLGYIESIIDRLHGKKHLILGNHDRLYPKNYIDMGFESVHTSLSIYIQEIDKKIILNHDPAASYKNRKQFFICGHVHNFFKYHYNVINVCVDM